MERKTDRFAAPAKPVEKKKKKKPAYSGGGYLDSLMLPPGQPLNQTVHPPGGGRAATKSPRRKPSSVEPMSPTWSHSQPDSDRARSVRRPSSKDGTFPVAHPFPNCLVRSAGQQCDAVSAVTGSDSRRKLIADAPSSGQ